MPSNLSKKPPCPGKKLPLSLIFAILFNKEKNMSPNLHDIDEMIEIIIIIKSKFFEKKNIEYENTNDVKIIEPNDPDIVLLGLIFVNFGPLNIFPKINPPKSEAIQPKSRQKIITLKFG